MTGSRITVHPGSRNRKLYEELVGLELSVGHLGSHARTGNHIANDHKDDATAPNHHDFLKSEGFGLHPAPDKCPEAAKNPQNSEQWFFVLEHFYQNHDKANKRTDSADDE